ncbi:hypothetical protein LPB79_13045 [Rhizobium sp. T136]|uniref:hypothetical protein n=1 Tax=Rhizobium sp. T136 TaxID=555319 RepID=UPI001E6262E3|nr:hypothetical protein [Rhizobium sp. T136]UFS83173.1 hypothetical protein LPB79_13045 [Rhizobium sp. T136]
MKFWFIEVLEGGNSLYLCGTGVLSSNRDDCLKYDLNKPAEKAECIADYEYLESQGYNASINASESPRFTGHSVRARLEYREAAE